MSKIKQFFEQLFCKHANIEEYRYTVGYGYVYQCPKCGSYFLYLNDPGGTMKISKLLYDKYIERAKSYGGETNA